MLSKNLYLLLIFIYYIHCKDYQHQSNQRTTQAHRSYLLLYIFCSCHLNLALSYFLKVVPYILTQTTLYLILIQDPPYLMIIYGSNQYLHLPITKAILHLLPLIINFHLNLNQKAYRAQKLLYSIILHLQLLISSSNSILSEASPHRLDRCKME